MTWSPGKGVGNYLTHCKLCGKEIKRPRGVAEKSKTGIFFCSRKCQMTYLSRYGSINPGTNPRIAQIGGEDGIE